MFIIYISDLALIQDMDIKSTQVNLLCLQRLFESALDLKKIDSVPEL